MSLILTPRAAPGATIGPVPQPVKADGRTVVIGRAPGADLLLPDPSNRVSSRHCTVAPGQGGWVLTDTSTNGTFVNGQRVTAPQPLREGDVLRIGDYDVAVSLGGGQTGVAAGRMALDSWGRPAAVAPAPAAPTGAPAGDAVSRLLAAAGLTRQAVAASDDAVVAAAGALLRVLAGGVARMVAARARARGELGVAADPPSTNPFTRGDDPAALLAALLAAPADAAGEAATDALARLDRHQRASLGAMQGALRATLDGFAPEAVRARAGGDPAACWKAYEAAFAGREGFVESFARELAKSYAAVEGKG